MEQEGRPGPKTRRAARNAALLAGAEILGKVSTLALTAVAARRLSDASFGAFSYALGFGMLLAALPLWGFGTLMVREGAAEPAGLASLVRRVLTIRITAAIVLTPVVLAVAVWGRPTGEARLAVLLIWGALILDSVTAVGASAADARQQVGLSSVALIVNRWSTMALGIVAVMAGFGAGGLSSTFLVGSLLGCIAMWVAVRRLGVSPRPAGLRDREIAGVARRSMLVGLNTVSAMALFRIDTVILAAIKGDEAVATYAAAYRLLETVLFISWSLAGAALPGMSASPETWRIRHGIEQAWAVIGIAYVPFGVVLLLRPGPVITLLFGSHYGEVSRGAAVWLAPSPLLFALGYLTTIGLNALHRYRDPLKATLIALVVNVVANILLIPRFSATGAAIATSASFMVQGGVGCVLLARRVGRPHFLASAVGVGAGGLAMAATLLVIRIGVIVDVLIGGVAFLAVWYPLTRLRQPAVLGMLTSVVRRKQAPG